MLTKILKGFKWEIYPCRPNELHMYRASTESLTGIAKVTKGKGLSEQSIFTVTH